MRKLSQIMAMGRTATIPILESGNISSWQSLVLFDDVLDADKILSSKEFEKVIKYHYGQMKTSWVHTTHLEDLHDWVRDEFDKATTNEEAKAFKVDESFEDLALKGHSDEYFGPLHLFSIQPDPDVENDFLVLTCSWSDSIIKNPNHIVGVIADTDDLLTVVIDHLTRG